MLVSAAGRVARAFVAETRGAYRPSWSPEDIARQMSEILDRRDVLAFPVLPTGFADHLRFAFDMALETDPASAPSS